VDSVLTPPPPLVSDPVLQAITESLVQARTGSAPSLDVYRCLLYTTPIIFLTTFWTELGNAVTTSGDLDACRRLATFVLSTPRLAHCPPLLPIFLHVVLPSAITLADHVASTTYTLQVELIVEVISSALTAALFVEWALLSVCKEQSLVLGQPALSMARRLGGELRRRVDSQTSILVVQRLSSSQAFMTNFPTFMAEL
jgi:mediator of RNA polymerase II transcription subunit 5